MEIRKFLTRCSFSVNNTKIMNNIFKKGRVLPYLIIFVFSLTACKKDFLEKQTLSYLNEEAIFSDSANVSYFVNSRYTNISFSWNPTTRFDSGNGFASASDEAGFSFNLGATPYSLLIITGAANASNADNKLWTLYYKEVRAANLFLRNKDKIPVGIAFKNQLEGEVRFLRAWYSFMMLKTYGGFPLIGDKVFEESEVIDAKRNTYEECVNFIVEECNVAAGLLVPNYDANNYGRATKGAALSLKARALLYAASPLVNGSSELPDPGSLVSYGTYDQTRWKKALDAAIDVMDLKIYKLYDVNKNSTDFYNMFLQRNQSAAREHIFAFMRTTGRYLETTWNPVSRGYQNSASGFPTQELVDAFGMSNGLPITDPESGYQGNVNPDQMYVGRDPRFYYTISYNGSSRAYTGYADAKVWTYTGVIPTGNASVASAMLDGIYKAGATSTGYYSRKMLYDLSVPGGSENSRPDVLMRYAEILLIAAEASNELYGPSNDVYNWIGEIRKRAGIPEGTYYYGLKKNGTSKEALREIIQNERQMEFAYEEHRYWDVRRWKIAPQTENREIHGMEITRASNGNYTYKKIVNRRHVFNNAMYFWPIPQSELTKSSLLIQNPGY